MSRLNSVLDSRSFLWTALFLGWVGVVHAHPVSLTDAVLDVREDSSRFKLSITVEDLVLYYELKANKEFRFEESEIKKAAASHRAFLEQRLQFLDQTGKPIPLNYQGVDVTAVPAEGVLQTELKARWLTYQWAVQSGARPNYLTVSQEFGELQPATMDCMFLQNGFLLEKTKQLVSGQVYSLELDWENPPTKRPDLAALKEAKQRQLRDRLGIASYSSLYSFLYLSGRELRHEILIPVLTLQEWFGIEREDPDFLSVSEQERVADQVFDLILKNRVEINGEEVEPTLARVNFFGLDIRDFALNKPPEKISIYQARIGLIAVYKPQEYPVESIKMHWNSYNKYAPMLRSTVLVGKQTPFGHFFVEDAPIFEYELPKSKNERLAPVRIAIKDRKVNSSDALRIADAVIERVYTSVNQDDPRARYRQLADLVMVFSSSSLFMHLEKSLKMAEQGGSIMSVHSTKVTDVNYQHTGNQLVMELSWEVVGSVEHWGHIHTRRDSFQGSLTLEPNRGRWVIVSFGPKDQVRHPIKTRVRY
ncbi:MAG TPA: hypothetical protein DEP12_08700 [Planctomycetaceae bacterium]|nr:hypothetical protein [Planctomycetaceae bacterium]